MFFFKPLISHITRTSNQTSLMDMKVLRSFYPHKSLFLLNRTPRAYFSLSLYLHSTAHHFFANDSTLAVPSSRNESNSSDTTKNSPRVWSFFEPRSGGTGTHSGADTGDANGASEPKLSSSYEGVEGVSTERAPENDSFLSRREKTQTELSGDNEKEGLKKEKRYGSVMKANSVTGVEGAGDIVGIRRKGKSKTSWVCESCGFTTGQWWGSCKVCNEFGTMKPFSEANIGNGSKVSGIEVSEKAVRSWLPQKPGELHPLRLTDVSREMNQFDWRIPLSGLFGSEVARVLGGGLVPGSLVLVGGDPGVGKSTLLLQVAATIADGENLGGPAPVVYVSGEESVEQIGNRADRMNIETQELFLYCSTDIEDILRKSHSLSPRALIVDSIQTVYLKGVVGSAGGISQVRECTSALLRFAKTTHIPVLLIGHVTKAGDIAGPRILEHIVDVVLYMEGEKYSSHRLLRPVKNRFGSTDELGVFKMSQSGLAVVSNPSEMFLTEQHSDSEFLAGLAVAVVMDGSRSFLIEVQALCVSGSSISRHVTGIQLSRADMIISVLIKQAGLMLQENAIFLNVVSGVTLTETAGDVAIAAAICSSFLEFPIPNDIAFIGEIGLGGELRSVPRMEKRVHTVAKLGYKMCIVPKSAEKSLMILGFERMKIIGCKNLKEVINTVFKA